MTMIDRIAEFHDDLTVWRRDIHAHPELAFEEHRTADIVATKLGEFGLEVHRGLAETGVVGSLRVGNGARAIGLRADMDALPLQEFNDFAHRSRHDGKMHACGHDGHTTMLLGAARYLAETMNFDGTVHFIFQPAEEGYGGGRVMVEEGLFGQFPVDAVFGMHNRPGLAVGKFALRPGPMMAAAASFDIHVTGRGAHGARPESGIDPVLTAAHIVTALQSIVARNTSPHDAAVLSATQIHAGNAYAVIPEEAVIRGTARAFRAEVMTAIAERMVAVAEGVAQGFGATAKVDFREIYPPLINDAAETRFAADVAADLVGEENVDRAGPLIMASEDFSFMLNARPGAFVLIGNGEGQWDGGCEVHNPNYDFNDRILPLGASFLAKLVETRLAKDAD